MRFGRLAALAGAMFILGAAPVPTTLQNGGFEDVDEGGLVEWRLSAGLAAYAAAQDPAGHTGQALVLRRKPTGDAGYGAAAQTISAIPYRGQRIRYRAWVRTEARPGAHGGLWMRVDLTGRMSSFFNNMADRPITEPSWRAYELETYVPRDAQFVSVGALMIGDGALWLDDASVEVVDAAPDGSGKRMSRPARAYLDRAITLLRTNHINAARADWTSLRHEAYAAAGDARAPADTYAAIQMVIGELGEKHTFFRPPEPPRPAPAPGAAASAPSDDGNRLPTVDLSGRVGVVTIPSLSTYNEAQVAFGKRYVSTLHDFFRGAQSACGWIVDLRENYGGNMWPMLNGLRPILDDGPFGAFNDPMHRSHVRWMVIGDSIAIEGQAPEALDWPRIPGRTAPVAVLIGPHTTSSGEMTAIAFRGRPGSRSFGQSSAGYTTANEPVAMPDGASLVITSAYVEDRNGVGFTGPLTPDEVTPLDQAPAAARAWLATQGCPAA